MPSSKTSDQILRIARDILVSEGLDAVSFDAIAHRLGRSKQAVLYWYPSKHALLAALFLPWLEAEAKTARAALEGVNGGAAVRAFVRAIADFHCDDLDRFRMMYLVLQTTRPGTQGSEDFKLLAQVHPITDTLYGTLASRIGEEPTLARQQAVAIHSAVLGLVLMVALADSLNDPLKHSREELVEALVQRLSADI